MHIEVSHQANNLLEQINLSSLGENQQVFFTSPQEFRQITDSSQTSPAQNVGNVPKVCLDFLNIEIVRNSREIYFLNLHSSKPGFFGLEVSLYLLQG